MVRYATLTATTLLCFCGSDRARPANNFCDTTLRHMACFRYLLSERRGLLRVGLNRTR